MWNVLKNFRIRRILQRYPVNQDIWESAIAKLSILNGLGQDEMNRLKANTTVFLYDKRFTGAQGLEPNQEIRLIIAVQACLLTLNLGQAYYTGWVEIIVYPDAFRVNHDRVDRAGVVHSENNILSGESWEKGPVILSWSDVYRDLQSEVPGHNVVIHEFAHKLDMLNGVANGMPPLHTDMDKEQWTDTLSSAYDSLNHQLRNGDSGMVNAYAATDPAEFFAVVSEYFFVKPNILIKHCPQVYSQLRLYYRQDPMTRLNT